MGFTKISLFFTSFVLRYLYMKTPIILSKMMGVEFARIM